MRKKRLVIISCLAILIVVLIIGNMILATRRKEVIAYLTKQEILKNYEVYLQEQHLLTKSLKEVQTHKSEEKEIYELANDCYFVMSFHNNSIEKVYLYMKKENRKQETYLEGMIDAVQPKLSMKKKEAVLNQMLAHDEKASELGVLEDFTKYGYQYMTIEKENGTMINYFIYFDEI